MVGLIHGMPETRLSDQNSQRVTSDEEMKSEQLVIQRDGDDGIIALPEMMKLQLEGPGELRTPIPERAPCDNLSREGMQMVIEENAERNISEQKARNLAIEKGFSLRLPQNMLGLDMLAIRERSRGFSIQFADRLTCFQIYDIIGDGGILLLINIPTPGWADVISSQANGNINGNPARVTYEPCLDLCYEPRISVEWVDVVSFEIIASADFFTPQDLIVMAESVPDRQIPAVDDVDLEAVAKDAIPEQPDLDPAILPEPLPVLIEEPGVVVSQAEVTPRQIFSPQLMGITAVLVLLIGFTIALLIFRARR